MSLATIRSVSYPKSNLKSLGPNTDIKNNAISISIKDSNLKNVFILNTNQKSEIRDKNSITHIAEILPFRVRFQNTKIGGYSPSNPAPIGIAVIGFNNYIL